MFVEASAGTGKTYFIEHYTRDLIKEGMDADRILVVTFTRAATRELKMRIGVDETRVFTIHGFCYEMLREFPFEAGLSLDLKEMSYQEQLNVMHDFIRTRMKDYSPFQIAKAVGRGELAKRLLHTQGESGRTFDEIYEEFCRTDHSQDIERIPASRSQKVKRFTSLLKQGTWTKEEFNELLSLDVKCPVPKLIQEGRDPLPGMAYVAHQMLDEKEALTFDGILKTMEKSLEKPAFLKAVQGAFDAAIIDEFQDTDPLQWRIFEKLFLRPGFPFTVVGDPKQSIYAFRGADLYTYMHAREVMGDRKVLGTNYRSHPKLVHALNQLFEKPGLFALPKLGTSLTYEPVEAGITEEGIDEPLQLVEGDEESFFAFIAKEAGPGSCVLVKDRYQSQRLSTYLESKGVSTQSTRGKLVKESPFFSLLRAQGLDESIFTSNVHPELLQIACHIAERDVTFQELASQEEGDDSAARIYPQQNDEAVTLLTTFASKGLEFDTVFALDMAFGKAASPEEEAEKMRLLYVALTRAKKRAFLFVPSEGKGHSPAERLLAHEHNLSTIYPTNDAPVRERKELPPPPEKKSPKLKIKPGALQSFTSLAQTAAPIEKDVPRDFNNPTKNAQTLPAGAQTGLILHELLEKGTANLTGYEGWEETLHSIVQNALNLPILQNSTPVMREMEFLYPTPEGMMKGVIDLVFEKEGKVYLLDWKSNWLEDYSQESLKKEMEHHDYLLQAKIYREALERLLKHFNKPFGGTYYVFLRESAVLEINLGNS